MARSGFAAGFSGFLIGVVTGLGIAAGAMLIISKSPVPFVDKVDKVTADVDPAAKLAGGVDPNARLNSSASQQPEGEPGTVQTVRAPDAAGSQAAPAPASASFWVQVGAFKQKSDAESSAASLAMQGIGAQVQGAGSTGWRVRVGPFDSRSAAGEVLNSLSDLGFKPILVEQK